MRYGSPAAFRAGLEARLLNQSRKDGVDLARLRRRVVFERLLARLARSGDADWVLKGGMALEVRLGGVIRSMPKKLPDDIDASGGITIRLFSRRDFNRSKLDTFRCSKNHAEP